MQVCKAQLLDCSMAGGCGYVVFDEGGQLELLGQVNLVKCKARENKGIQNAHVIPRTNSCHVFFTYWAQGWCISSSMSRVPVGVV